MYSKIDQDQKNKHQNETFLSNEEVEQLVENFNSTIEKMTLESEIVRPKLEESHIKLEHLTKQKEQLEKEINEYKEKIDQYQPQINELLNNQKDHYEQNPKINQIYKKFVIQDDNTTPAKDIKQHMTFEKAVKSEPNILFEDNNQSDHSHENYALDKQYQNVSAIIKSNDSKLTQQEKESLQNALQMFISESEAYQSNQQQFSKLFTESLKNREQVLRKEAKLLIIQYCIHCKQRFSPLCNNEGSCVYHMGKLKFYSCKTCGCDEYYNCCGKCLKCCKGCAIGKHAAKEKVYRNEITPQSKPSIQSLSSISEPDFYSIQFENVQFINKKV